MADNKKSIEFKTKRHDARKQMLLKYISNDKNCISTGIPAVDAILNGGLYNNLYILGAESSVGKTAFMTAIAKNAARSGVHVLYFALEMTQDEFYARGVSSLSMLHNRIGQGDAIAYEDIFSGKADKELICRLNNEYFEYYDNIYFIDQEDSWEAGGYTVNDIVNKSMCFKDTYPDEQVMVVVDYLQYLRPANPNTSDKQATDDTVFALKSLSTQMPVLAASSISRSNYGRGITTHSYKESGNIEYTGGVLLGWNWDGYTDTTNQSTRQQTAERCSRTGYREMTLEVLKARNSAIHTGKCGAKMKYYPAYDFFLPADKKQQDRTPLKV